jgi:exoribonuclease-2
MPDTPRPDSLVLYKQRPARVIGVADKIEIQLEGGNRKRVRPKDVELLHPGPLRSLDELTPCEGDVEEAWELLEGEQTRLPELAELIYGEHTPATAWATWRLVAEGLEFRGRPDAIEVRPRTEVEQERAQREARARAKQDWEDFLERVRSGRIGEEDHPRLEEVIDLALERRGNSRILEALGIEQSREKAHALLLRLGLWREEFNPHPLRLQVPMDPPRHELPALPDEDRRDLTHLHSFAIDDAGNQDPDDAIAYEDGRIWVHVADVAALVPPDSPADIEARARGANLYLPETTIPMLPEAATGQLGLGLNGISPALSFGISLDEDGAIGSLEITPSWVKVTRLSYDEAEHRLDESPLREIRQLTERFHRRRQAAGAARLDLPEVRIRVEQGEVLISPLPRLDSRSLVTECMLMAGEAVARHGLEHGLPLPFSTQPPPDSNQQPQGLAEHYALRRQFKPSQIQSVPAPHAGLGLEVYTQSTSPLRRYSDLLAHQQLRAWLHGGEPLSREQLAERIAQADQMARILRRTERLSNTHWKLIWLRRNKGWQGEGVLVERNPNNPRRGTVLIPQLALDARISLSGEPELGSGIRLSSAEVDIPELTVRFQARWP